MLKKGDQMLAGILDSKGKLTGARVPCTIVEVRQFKDHQSARVRYVHNGKGVGHIWVQDKYFFPMPAPSL